MERLKHRPRAPAASRSKVGSEKRTSYKKSEASRRVVLDAAISMLSERGLASTSIQDIADAAGLSKGAVHYHFDSKEDLLHHVLLQCCATLERRILAALAEPGTPMDCVRRAIGEMWIVRRDGVPEIRVLSELHLHSRQNETVRASLGMALVLARQQMIDIGLQRLVDMGLRPRVSLAVVPRLILATLDGLSIQHELDPIPPREEGELLRALEATSLALFEI